MRHEPQADAPAATDRLHLTKAELEKMLERTAQLAADKAAARCEERLKKLEDSLQKIINAFPAGDTEGHRRYHDALIEDFQTRKRLMQAIKEKTIIALIWSGLGWITLACWNEFKRRYLPGLSP